MIVRFFACLSCVFGSVNVISYTPTLGPRDGRALWHALAPYRSRLPTLRVYLTEYPWPVAALIPPVAVVIGTNRGTLTATQYAAIVERAAAALAAAV